MPFDSQERSVCRGCRNQLKHKDCHEGCEPLSAYQEEQLKHRHQLVDDGLDYSTIAREWEKGK